MSKENQIDKQAVEEMARVIEQRCNRDCIPSCDECIAQTLYKAGYRKQSDNVIELPCKVGDTMYVKYDGVVFPVVVNAIRLDTKKNSNRICVTGTIHLYGDYSHKYKATFPFNSIGKSLFYTEAEAKMKGGKEG